MTYIDGLFILLLISIILSLILGKAIKIMGKDNDA